MFYLEFFKIIYLVIAGLLGLCVIGAVICFALGRLKLVIIPNVMATLSFVAGFIFLINFYYIGIILIIILIIILTINIIRKNKDERKRF